MLMVCGHGADGFTWIALLTHTHAHHSNTNEHSVRVVLKANWFFISGHFLLISNLVVVVVGGVNQKPHVVNVRSRVPSMGCDDAVCDFLCVSFLEMVIVQIQVWFPQGESVVNVTNAANLIHSVIATEGYQGSR